MDEKDVLTSSTHIEGLQLIANLWDAINKNIRYKQATAKADAKYKSYIKPTREDVHDLMILAVHRLTFLELVTTGLTYMEMHDAQAYAKFVEKKRKLEDMDIDELRVMLR